MSFYTSFELLETSSLIPSDHRNNTKVRKALKVIPNLATSKAEAPTKAKTFSRNKGSGSGIFGFNFLFIKFPSLQFSEISLTQCNRLAASFISPATYVICQTLIL